jgi:hypothetical protein
VERHGIKGLFTPAGFKTAYTEYQQHIIDELNESTAGMPPRLRPRARLQHLLTALGRHAL